MKTRDAGEGTSLKQGEAGAGEFSLKEKLLSTSLSGDSISLSPIWMSLLILCDKGGRCEGEGSLGEVGKGRFLSLWECSCKAGAACRRWTQA